MRDFQAAVAHHVAVIKPEYYSNSYHFSKRHDTENVIRNFGHDEDFVQLKGQYFHFMAVEPELKQ